LTWDARIKEFKDKKRVIYIYNILYTYALSAGTEKISFQENFSQSHISDLSLLIAVIVLVTRISDAITPSTCVGLSIYVCDQDCKT